MSNGCSITRLLVSVCLAYSTNIAVSQDIAYTPGTPLQHNPVMDTRKTGSRVQQHKADFVVKGKVKDENGPVAGVTVTEKGTSNASTSDAQGNFSLSVKNANSVLVLTYVGYKTVEISVAGRSTIEVKMETDSQELSGVVVTALGITRAKKIFRILC